MACFLVPVAEAIGVTIAGAVLKHRDKKKEREMKAVSGAEELSAQNTKDRSSAKKPFYRKLDYLSWLLWGGSLLLLFEHIWHGEIVPWFPFFTAAESAEGVMTMLKEMGTAGVAMAALVTLVWCGMLAVSAVRERRAEASEALK
ncbi:MAG: hypothetical protein LUD51_05190 [Clostridia bacterium]|nr:hypothetical protein [Clostridia bacterium]